MQRHQIFERPLGYVQLTSLSTATTLSIPANTKLILVRAEGQAVRWRDDGPSPTAAVGYPLAVGDELRYTGWAPGQAKLKFIEQVAGAILNVLFYGAGDQ